MRTNVDHLYLGHMDIFTIACLIAVLTIFLYYIARIKILGTIIRILIFIVTLVLYGAVLPGISQTREIQRVVAERGVDDAFTLLYTYLRYPVYWLLGGIQLIFFILLYIKTKMKENGKIEDTNE